MTYQPFKAHSVENLPGRQEKKVPLQAYTFSSDCWLFVFLYYTVQFTHDCKTTVKQNRQSGAEECASDLLEEGAFKWAILNEPQISWSESSLFLTWMYMLHWLSATVVNILTHMNKLWFYPSFNVDVEETEWK